MTPSFLEGLNDRQLEAVTLPHASALILAGAGSGKTRVLTTRIAWLIHTGQISPGGVLAVTFTNKAAREMLTRIASMLPINTRGMWVGTFHGLCNRMLRMHHREAKLPQLFQILDSQDQLALIKRLLKAANFDEERFPPRQAAWYINSHKEEGRRARVADEHDDFTRRMKEIYGIYETQCQREGVVDFAELLLRCHELLENDEILRDHYRRRFRHILVDEFQDTNRLQYRWLKLLAGRDSAVFAVGDDDQSIYAFRGASAANMQELQRDFAINKVIKLEQNYRSHGNILEAANALIAHNQRRLGKNLWTAEGNGELLRIFEAATDFEEANFIVDEVKSLQREGVPLSQMALLYRSNAQSRVLEHALFSAGLSYRVYGGLRFFERQEIKHALAYLRLLASDDDDGALLRVINFPARGIGARTIEQLQSAAAAQGRGLWRTAQDSVGAIPPPGGIPAKGLGNFIALIGTMRAATQGLKLPEIIAHVIEHSRLRAHYKSDKDGQDRLENLDELVNAAAAFGEDGQHEDTGLAAFLAHAALEAGENQAQAGADALQLMTVHSAKGLEFHSVFISGVEAGLFPHENSLVETDGVEEERRLMYVALTRARRRLYLSYAQSRMLHGQTRYGIASSFLQEIPAQLMRSINRAPSNKHRGDFFVSGSAALAHASLPWRVGQNVHHPKFGLGVIVNTEGQSGDARVQVNFRRDGLKWLAVEYAKLTAA